MRISSNTMFESATSRITDQQARVSKLQQQLASGLRIQSPSDDPVGAAKVLTLSQGQAMNAQQGSNRVSALNSLTQQESVLQSVTDVIQGIQEQVVGANNATYSDADRKMIASELRVRLQDMMSLANSRDASGNYLFSGFKDNVQPFTGSGASAVYNGDNGLKQLQVSSGRQMAVNDTGDTIFMNVPAKSLYSSTATGSASLSDIRVADSTQVKNGHQYQVKLDGSANYQVFDTTLDPDMTGTPAASGAYTSPQTIQVDGLQMTVSGPNDAGNTINVSPVRAQSIFKTVGDLIDTLEKPVTNDAERARMVYNLGVAGDNLSNALNNVLSVRASGGARLQELDSIDTAGKARELQYASQISDIQDVDYVQAISEFTQRQQNLQAAQQSFVKVANLSLFNYL